MTSTTRPHDEAVAAFVERVEAATLPDLQRLLLFGSVARSTHERDSDIDVLAVLDDGADEVAIEERLRDMAYDVMLDHGAAFSIHGVTESAIARRSDHPFFERVLDEGKTIFGSATHT